MPYYERPKMVHYALRSLENIKYENYEIAIVDDGSVKAPMRSILNSGKYNIKNYKLYETNDSIENKLRRGSTHGLFVNHALLESDADIRMIFCDDDALYPTYLENLNEFYNKNPDIMYSYSHIVPFDPFTEDPETLNENRVREFDTRSAQNLNKTWALNPYCQVDATQVSWRRECNHRDNVYFPNVQTKDLDASFYAEMFNRYGNCVYNGFKSCYKGFHKAQLGNQNGADQYRSNDLE